METAQFTVRPFKNRNGFVSWRVSGWLLGTRIRKNFASAAEAEAERQVLEVQRLQTEGGVRSAITRLSAEQLQEAESAFLRLRDRKCSLLFYLDFALANYREPEREKQVADAVTIYLAARAKDHERGLLSASAKMQINWELDTFRKRFAKESVAQLTVQNLQGYLERSGGSLKTFNNRRAILHTFFRFAVQQDWVDRNPLAKLPHFKIAHRRGSAVTLTAHQCAELMAHVETVAEGKLVPFFALCLFAGIRPSLRDGEIAKLRPEHIRLDTGSILIEPEVSKVRMKRLVTIHPQR